MRVSILLPVFNVEPFVDSAIASIAAQTFGDWEVVAVDDASTDRTAEKLDAWAARDARIRVFRNPQNRGMTGNWNRALGEARADLVIKLDGDDAFRPRTLEVLVSALQNDGVIAAGVRTLMCDESLEPFDGLPADDAMMHAGIDPYSDHDLPADRWFAIAAQGVQLWHSCALMWRRAVVTSGYDERFGCASDTELVWRLLDRPGLLAHRGYPGVLYRIRPGSVSDVFRARGWLTGEGTAANLLLLHRYGRRARLPRPLRLRYASLWERWRADREENRRKIPPEIFSRLESVVAEVDAPARLDTLLLHLRDKVMR